MIGVIVIDQRCFIRIWSSLSIYSYKSPTDYQLHSIRFFQSIQFAFHLWCNVNNDWWSQPPLVDLDILRGRDMIQAQEEVIGEGFVCKDVEKGSKKP
jgi:hypothetical protein